MIHIGNEDFFVLGSAIEQCRGDVPIGTPHKGIVKIGEAVAEKDSFPIQQRPEDRLHASSDTLRHQL